MNVFFQHPAETLISFFVLIMTIIVVHELGHYLIARSCGVAIDRFAIGFGRALASWRDKAGVEWRIGWIPLGGYVKFAGDSNAASIPDGADLSVMRSQIIANEGPGAELKYLAFKPVWQRALIAAAGPAANFLLAVILFSIFYGVFGEEVGSTRIAQVVPGSAAAAAGFHVDDQVVRVDDRPLRSFQEMASYVQYRAGIPLDFRVKRGADFLHIRAAPRPDSVKSAFGGEQTIGRLGLGSRGVVFKRYNPIEAAGLGVKETADITQTTVFYLGRILTGQARASELHSILGIAHAAGSVTSDVIAQAKAAHVNWLVEVIRVLVYMGGAMSVSVGLLNLMPIPVLDGGHLAFYAYEAIVRRPVAARVQAIGYRVGIILLVSLMLFATRNDLHPLHLFHLFGG